ncbi:response regulator transcription factor [Pseudonocardia sp. HH130630-07]|uniref:response regulator transcription factor n=1 Tax=Pseudonocardia sp. HH130630-07 TaxID=1690815 RepID=UPI000814D98E|nr:response regulator transcription factor [Pseudonocardia sp. HH130630-07]ANY05273.1 two-component system response regulator [Pseudonocardia sp. HH130630-07]
MRVVVVEDDTGVAGAVVDALRARGHGVLHAGTAAAAAELLADAELVLLDLGLPDGDGLALLRRIRQDSAVPVIVLTARSAERDVVRGLHLGADDYLVKPVRLRELLARIDAVARRVPAAAAAPSVVRVGDLEIDLDARRVTADGRDLALTAKEYAIVAALARRPGVAVSRQQVLDEVWGDATVAGSKSLDVHVAALRAKLDRPGLLATVRGFGFRLGR